MHANNGKVIPAHTQLPLRLWEFVGIVASLMALGAFAVDIMLPALGVIGETYKLSNANDQQFVVYAYLVGFGIPQLFFGPLSDHYGRKNLLRICIIGYAVFSFGCMWTQTFTALLAARFVQGLFSAGIRVIAMAIVRDVTSGPVMARIFSLVMTVFMVVPIIAPSIGQGVISLVGWSWTFGVLGVLALMLLIWVHFRLPETLRAENKQPLGFVQSLQSFRLILRTPVTFGYIAASGVIIGALYAFLGASEQIFHDVFDQGNRFAFWFAVVAITLAGANFLNSRIVERFGMRKIGHCALIAFILLALTNYIAMHTVGEKFILFMPLFALMYGCFGMLGANFSALAMEAHGRSVGSVSAAYGFATTTVSSVFGYLVSNQFNGTVAPILFGFTALGVVAFIIILITERGKLF